MSFHLLQSFSINFLYDSLGLLAPRLPSICISHAVLTAPLERSTYPNQQSLLSVSKGSQSSSPSFARSSIDLTVTTSSGLFDTAELSDHDPIIALLPLQVRLGQWPRFTGMEHGAPHTRAVYMATGLVREVE